MQVILDSCPGMETGLRVQTVGSLVLRYGLVLVIGWIGLMKFTEYEAKGIQPLVAKSPLMGWMYGFLTLRAFFTCTGCCRGCYRDFDWPSTLVNEGVSAW